MRQHYKAKGKNFLGLKYARYQNPTETKIANLYEWNIQQEWLLLCNFGKDVNLILRQNLTSTQGHRKFIFKKWFYASVRVILGDRSDPGSLSGGGEGAKPTPKVSRMEDYVYKYYKN